MSLAKVDLKPSIEALKAEFDNADGLAQEVQKFRKEAGVAAINELRYAGFHLLNFNASGNENELELVRAINHAKRAAYEASEGGILAALKVVKRFQEDYKTIVVDPHVKDWTQKLMRCDQIAGSLRRLRSEEEHEPHDHAAAMEAYHEMRGIALETDYARPEINKQLKKERHNTTMVISGLVLALFGVAVVVALFALPYWIGAPR